MKLIWKGILYTILFGCWLALTTIGIAVLVGIGILGLTTHQASLMLIASLALFVIVFVINLTWKEILYIVLFVCWLALAVIGTAVLVGIGILGLTTHQALAMVIASFFLAIAFTINLIWKDDSSEK